MFDSLPVTLATEGCGSGEVQEVSDLFVCRLLLHIRSLIEWSFYFKKERILKKWIMKNLLLNANNW